MLIQEVELLQTWALLNLHIDKELNVLHEANEAFIALQHPKQSYTLQPCIVSLCWLVWHKGQHKLYKASNFVYSDLLWSLCVPLSFTREIGMNCGWIESQIAGAQADGQVYSFQLINWSTGIPTTIHPAQDYSKNAQNGSKSCSNVCENSAIVTHSLTHLTNSKVTICQMSAGKLARALLAPQYRSTNATRLIMMRLYRQWSPCAYRTVGPSSQEDKPSVQHIVKLVLTPEVCWQCQQYH